MKAKVTVCLSESRIFLRFSTLLPPPLGGGSIGIASRAVRAWSMAPAGRITPLSRTALGLEQRAVHMLRRHKLGPH